MKLDSEYLKKLLNVFVESENYFVELKDFTNSDLQIDDTFFFHMQLLEDQELIEPLNKDGKGIGYGVTMLGIVDWRSKPLRLTSDGHELAGALNKSEMWDKIKGEFTEAPLGALRSVSKEMLSSFLKTQAKKHLDWE